MTGSSFPRAEAEAAAKQISSKGNFDVIIMKFDIIIVERSEKKRRNAIENKIPFGEVLKRLSNTF